MRVKFWGTRGSVPTPGRYTEKFGGNTACVEISEGDERLILDGGTGIRELGLEMANEPAGRATMLFSHLHWDHIQGLPFFLPFFQPHWTFSIFAPSRFRASLRKVLYKQMGPGVFPVNFAALSATIGFETLSVKGAAIGPFVVTAFLQEHPGGSYAYRVRLGDLTVIYATDNELDPEGYPEAYEAFVKEVTGADLFIADGQYTLEEYQEKRGWGHCALEYVARVAADAGIGRVAITHHDPMRDDEALTELEKRMRKAMPSTQVFFARDGLAVEV